MKPASSRNGLPEAALRSAVARPSPADRLRRDAWRVLCASPLYRHTLLGPAPAALRVRLNERWPGNSGRGAAILAGEIELCGEVVRNPRPTWFPPGAGAGWLAEWHGFSWLDDLIGAGAAARDPARALVQSWLRENTAGHPLAWRSDVAASRIFAWIVHFEELAGRESDRALRRAMLASIAAQVRHLGRVAGWEQGGAARLRALKGLVGGLAALGGSERRMSRALRALASELRAQILPDGGHCSRSPSVQLAVLRDLIDLRAALRAARRNEPAPLQQAIERMAPMLRFFRYGDRRLGLFNNAVEEDAVFVDLVLTRSETRDPAPMLAVDSGFQRLQAGQSLVVIDAGNPPRAGFDDEAHAGTLSFEMSHGRERIIVNCGGYRGAKPAWRRVARSSAAHSVLVVGDSNAVEIRPDGGFGGNAALLHCERAEEGGHQWIAASHDGYRSRFGLTYSRELYLTAEGEDLRGEDRLTGRAGVPFAVRFHLHPTVEASLLEGGGGARLRLAGGAAWRLRAAGAEMSLGESIYLGSGEPRKTRQVVLSGTTGDAGAAVRWALRHEPSLPAPAAAAEKPAEEKQAGAESGDAKPADNGTDDGS